MRLNPWAWDLWGIYRFLGRLAHVFSSTVLLHERNKHCLYCGAWKWKEETTNCCSNGEYVVKP